MKKILVIGPAWVGDMVIAQSLFRLLKQHSADIHIDVLAPAWTQPLLAYMPEISGVLSLPFAHGQWAWQQRWQLGKQLRSENYSQAIILPNSWKSALIPFAARISQRTGWLGENRWGLLNDYRRLHKKQLPLMMQRFAALGLPAECALPLDLPQPALQVDAQICRQTQEKYGLSLTQPLLALCPGAEFGPSKCWPAAYFAEVAQHYLQQQWQVILFGSRKDQPIGENIQHLTQGRCIDLCGKTTLGDAIELLAVTSQVISNDSGLMHIAAALDKPLIALYGSTDPGFTPPLSARAKILQLTLPCRPCFQRTCPLKHHRCMQALLPQQVIEASQSCVS